MDHFIDSFRADKSCIVTPTNKLSCRKQAQEVLPASQLKMSTKDKEGDFFSIVIEDSSISSLKTVLKGVVRQTALKCEQAKLRAALLRLELNIVENKALLLKEEFRNEPEVRFGVCDPLSTVICRYYNYKMELEETVSSSDIDEDTDEDFYFLPQLWTTEEEGDNNNVEQEDPTQDLNESLATSVSQGVSPRSRSDYTLHSIQDNDGNCCVVIVEAKWTMTIHSVAQAIGYFLAMMMARDSPPLVLVVDKESIRILLFPFKIDNKPLVNCLVLQPFPMFIDGEKMNTVLFELIILLCNKSCIDQLLIQHNSILNFLPIAKRRIRKISSMHEVATYYKHAFKVSQQKVEQQENENKLSQKRIRIMEEENKLLRATVESLQPPLRITRSKTKN